MKKILIGFLLLIISPFAYTIAKHEINLYLFEAQLDKVDELISPYDRILAKGHNYFFAGNGDMCGFEATRVYIMDYVPTSKEPLRSRIAKPNLSAAIGANSQYNRPEISTYRNGNMLVVSIQSGPYPAGFDFRCW